MKAITFILLLLIQFICNSETSGLYRIDLNKNWTLVNAPRNISISDLHLPISVHTVLLQANLIGDPFYRFNDLDLRWIVKEDTWQFKTEFELNSTRSASTIASLEFDSIDTVASVYLNKKLVLLASNQFLKYELFDVSDQLNMNGMNLLEVKFSSPVKQAQYLGNLTLLVPF